MKANKAVERKLKENERYVERLVRGLKQAIKRAGIVKFSVDDDGEIEISAGFRDGEWGWISERVVLVPVV